MVTIEGYYAMNGARYLIPIFYNCSHNRIRRFAANVYSGNYAIANALVAGCIS